MKTQVEKIIELLDKRIEHHENWLEHMMNSHSYQNITWWGAKVNELKEIRELLLREIK